MQLQTNISLRKLNTFGVAVQAKHFLALKYAEEYSQLISSSNWQPLSILILGGGSNILFTKDFEGLVIKNEVKGIELVQETEDHVWVRIGGGENWHQLVLHTIEKGWQGLENLSLIPGTVGAAPIQNIGAYAVEIKDIFDSLEALHLPTGETNHIFSKADCQFGYRSSIFKHKLKGEYLITHVTLKLNKKPILNTSYGAISQTLEKNGITKLTPKAISNAVIQIRQSKLPDPEMIGNCGSFFKNPEIPKPQFEQLLEAFPNIVSYPMPSGSIKVPAGWLIEQCGWKGKTLGNVGTYEKQALVIVNRGDATGEEARELAYKIQESVEAKFGIRLEPEVNII